MFRGVSTGGSGGIFGQLRRACFHRTRLARRLPLPTRLHHSLWWTRL